MATRASIEFDFKQAMAQADKLDSVAGELESLSNNKYNTTLQNISNNWTGDNSKKYLVKGNVLKDKILGSADELATIASDIREIARYVYKTEMAALEIAEQRSYH